MIKNFTRLPGFFVIAFVSLNHLAALGNDDSVQNARPFSIVDCAWQGYSPVGPNVPRDEWGQVPTTAGHGEIVGGTIARCLFNPINIVGTSAARAGRANIGLVTRQGFEDLDNRIKSQKSEIIELLKEMHTQILQDSVAGILADPKARAKLMAELVKTPEFQSAIDAAVAQKQRK